MYILIYVDDILLTGNSTSEINRILSNLHARFQMRNLGSLAQFLGIQSVPVQNGVILHQKHYAQWILERAGMQNAKSVSSPSSCKTVLTA